MKGIRRFGSRPDIQYVRDGRFGRGAYKPDKNDFAPRVGIAWTVTPETVIRSGAGIYYVRDIGNAVFDTVRNAPFTIRRDEPAESFRPNLSFEQPFARTGAPTFILAAQFDEPSSYVGQWSVGVQRELGATMSVEATYFGSVGRHLRRLMSYNNPEPSQLANTNLARPFPQFGERPGDGGAEQLALQRALSEAAEAILAGRELPQLVLVREIDRQRQRHPDVGRRFADAVEQLRPGSRDRDSRRSTSGALDDVLVVGSAVRQGSTVC